MILTVKDGEERILSKVIAVLADELQITTAFENQEVVLNFSDFTILPQQRQVFYKKKEIPLSYLEFQVLYYLASHPGRVFGKEQIYDTVWTREPESVDNAVRCLISGLRIKLRSYTKKTYIHTVRGIGYKFQIPEE